MSSPAPPLVPTWGPSLMVLKEKTMARMLGTWTRDWCPVCRTTAGPDCPSTARTRKSQRLREKRQWRRDMLKAPAA